MRLLLEIISKIDQKIDIAPYSGENTVILKHFKDKIKPTFITLENYFYQTHQGAVEIHVIWSLNKAIYAVSVLLSLNRAGLHKM